MSISSFEKETNHYAKYYYTLMCASDWKYIELAAKELVEQDKQLFQKLSSSGILFHSISLVARAMLIALIPSETANYYIDRQCYFSKREYAKQNPVERIEKIVFENEELLEPVFAYINHSPTTEFGGFFGYTVNEQIATVRHIISPTDAETRGLIGKRGPKSIELNTKKAKALGFGGSYHYHPGAGHFGPSLEDLNSMEENTFNLIICNMNNKPILVGHTLRNLYYPQAENPCELHRMSLHEFIEQEKNNI